jgi:uncharacterized protein (DUF58 family)
VEFHGLREYEPGNDLRLVHWKASARVGTLLVRDNVLPYEPRLTVVLDTSDVYSGDCFEEAVRITASMCVSARTDDIPVSLRSTGGGAPATETSGPGGTAYLDCLSGVNVSKDDLGLLSLSRLLSRASGETLVVVTGRPPPRALAQLSTARRRYPRVIVTQVGDAATGVASLKGVTLVSVGSLDDLESAWNGGGLR